MAGWGLAEIGTLQARVRVYYVEVKVVLNFLSVSAAMCISDAGQGFS